MPDNSRNRKLGLTSGQNGLVQIDVDKSSSHQLSQPEIASDNPCSRHLSGDFRFICRCKNNNNIGPLAHALR